MPLIGTDLPLSNGLLPFHFGQKMKMKNPSNVGYCTPFMGVFLMYEEVDLTLQWSTRSAYARQDGIFNTPECGRFHLLQYMFEYEQAA
jgi:hypothetical protein